MPRSPVHTQSTIIIPIGCPVFTADGQQIGDVAEVRDRWFEVQAGDEPGFWLDMRSVTAASDERVTLGFDAGELPQHRLSAPGSEAGAEDDSHMATGDRLDGHHAASVGTPGPAAEGKE
jgi:hypothetical protein